MEVAFCQTISFNADTFEYDAVAQENGNATIIKFPNDEKKYSPGDVFVVVSNGEINLHGIIGKIEKRAVGCAFAFVLDFLVLFNLCRHLFRRFPEHQFPSG